jgi:hypothetical protein
MPHRIAGDPHDRVRQGPGAAAVPPDAAEPRGGSAAHYAEDWAELAIEDGRLLKGSLPRRALRMVREWRRAHEDELRENWERVQQPEAPAEIQPLP